MSASGLDERGPLWNERPTRSFLVPIVMRAADLVRAPLAAVGIDYPRFRLLLEMRLELDERGTGERPSGFAGWGMVILVGFTWFTGIFVGLAALAKLPPELWMAIVAAHTMGMVAFVIVTTYVAMLVDTTDIAVLAPRPVPDRTLFAARLAHAAVYTTLVATACAFWPIALGWISYPTWSVLIGVPIVVVLSATTSLGFVALLFAAALRVFGATQFQRVAFCAQIGAAVSLMGGMQMALPLIQGKASLAWIQGDSWSRILLPPLEQGGLYGLLLGRAGANVALAVAAILVPFASLVLATALASNHFVAGLQGEIVRATTLDPRWRTSFFNRIGALCTRSRDERAGFDFVLANSRRDKVFLRAGLPMLMGFAVMGVAQSIAVPRHEMGNLSVLLVFPLYLLLIGTAGLIESMRLGENPEAAWVLRITPIESLKRFTVGGVKALLLGTLAPTFLALSAMIVALHGAAAALDVLLALALVAAASLAVVPWFRLRVPFSKTPKVGEMDARNFGVTVGLGLAMGGLVGFHAVARLHPVTVAVAGILAAVATVVFWRRLHRIGEPVWN
jgi:hypothetical protein